MLVTVHPPFAEMPLGIFVCFDILFPTPSTTLVAQGVRHFLYSSAIPLVGALAMEAWTLLHQSTILGSCLQDGQSGVFVNGTRVTASPASGVDAIIMSRIQ